MGFRGFLLAAPPDADREEAPQQPAFREDGVATAIAHDPERALTVFAAGEPLLATASGAVVRGSRACARAIVDGNHAVRLEALSPGGHYALAIVDGLAGKVTLLTDRMGTIPLYFRVSDDCVCFGTTLAAAEPGGGGSDIDPQAVYDYVYFHMVPAPRAIARGAGKLRAAECGRLQPGAAARRHRHWTPDFRERAAASRDASAQALRRTLREAIAASIPSAGTTGAFLSGGLDSSTIAGMLSELQGGGCTAVAIGFDAEGYDEMPYARLAARHFGVDLIERYVTPDDVVSALPTLAAGFDEPFGNSSALPAYFCALTAREAGIDTLLAGDGGDELFAGNERYTLRPLLAWYRTLPAAVRRTVDALANRLPESIALLRRMRALSEQAELSIPERLQRYNFLNQFPAQTVFEDDFLAAVDVEAPLAAWCRTFSDAPDDSSDLNRMLYLDWQYTLADNDLRKVGQACKQAGVSVRYPMLADSLVDLSAHIPSNWKLAGGELRAFYRAALAGWLPKATLDKRKHGFGLPFGIWMRQHRPLAELAYDSIGDLARRGIFREAFLQRAIAMHRQGHAAYYGELVWLLTVLELWLAGRRAKATGSGASEAA